MAVTINGTSGITFNDTTSQTTAATAPTTTQVLNATAAASVGAVGSYAFLARYPSTLNNTIYYSEPGSTYAGSGLRYASTNQTAYFGSAPAGTWMCMGRTASYGEQGPYGTSLTLYSSLWLRIS